MTAQQTAELRAICVPLRASAASGAHDGKGAQSDFFLWPVTAGPARAYSGTMAHRIVNSLRNLSLALGLLALASCQQSRDARVAPAKETTPLTLKSSETEKRAPAVTLVTDPSLVCMVNNQFMGMAQIPVEIDGKTYYGCCPMCRDRLQGDAALRTATDPLTLAPVDKASAVIGKTATGSALYFAKLENLHAFAQRDQTP